MKLKKYKQFIKESKEEKALWTYEGDFKVDKSMVENGKFIKGKIPDIITGNFYCYNNQLTSLEGGPKEVGGDFDCSYNQLTSLEGAPREIGKFFNCYNNKLLSLKGGPKKVGGCFDCHDNQLTSLEGSPKKIEGNFKCYYNKLTSLEGAPKKVGGYFYCSNNQLTSLEEVSKKVRIISSDLEIENKFINSGSYINNYWNDLLKYMIKEKIDLQEVKSWPKGFPTDETIKSAKGISKFNL